MFGRLGSGKQQSDDKANELLKGRKPENFKDLNSPTNPEQTEEGVKHFTDGSNPSEDFNQDVVKRHQEFNKLGNGTPLERISKSLAPSSTQGNSDSKSKDSDESSKLIFDLLRSKKA